MKSYFEEGEDKDILVQWRARCEMKITDLYEDLIRNTKQNVKEVLQQQHTRETFELQTTQKEYDTKLFNLSKDLALKLKSKTTDEEVLKKEFDKLWDRWVTELTRDTPPERTLNFWGDAVQILSLGNELASVHERKSLLDYREIDIRADYSPYILKLRRQKIVHYVPCMNQLSFEDNELVRTLAKDVIEETEKSIKKIGDRIRKLGDKDSYIQEITDQVRKRVECHQNENQRIKLNKLFTLDLCLHVCELMNLKFTEHHKKFRGANDPRVYLSKKKPQYYSVFKNYCRGATTTKVFGELICSNLRESVLQAVYNNTAIGLATNIDPTCQGLMGTEQTLRNTS
ncbi:hypothetical protein QTP70_001744 [Hemibagrus guttatus]|uniref:Interferon-induced very large GTPase 1 domain-containing protein n=1 Tax=Hemibagrus guttatus TaxID=175788 RepID=A0AAE0UJ38_9TELE|nr:hypothetical protein QTP70_001744 [Hemibagrus guttatus]